MNLSKNMQNAWQEMENSQLPSYMTTQININRINIIPNDYDNPVIDYYNPLLRFEPCLNQLELTLICYPNIHGNFIWIIIEININPDDIINNYLILPIFCRVLIYN